MTKQYFVPKNMVIMIKKDRSTSVLRTNLNNAIVHIINLSFIT